MTYLRALDRTWGLAFGEAPPIRSSLRTGFADRWVRFHSLPSGKRYAESPAERDEIRSRHAAVLGQLFEADEPRFVLSGCYAGRDGEVPRPTAWTDVDTDAQRWRVVVADDSDDDPSFLHVWASACTWRPGAFDRLLARVAEWQVVEAAMVSARSGACYHPYDGGGDVIHVDRDRRDALARRFASWRSERLDGL